MPIGLYRTDRNFIRGDFIDRYGEKCSIQESSLAGEACIWLGCSEDNRRMHLTQEMAADLIPLLQCFVDGGDLRVHAIKEDLSNEIPEGTDVVEELRAALMDQKDWPERSVFERVTIARFVLLKAVDEIEHLRKERDQYMNIAKTGGDALEKRTAGAT